MDSACPCLPSSKPGRQAPTASRRGSIETRARSAGALSQWDDTERREKTNNYNAFPEGGTNYIQMFITARYQSLCSNLILKKWANPGLFFIYFWYFQTNNTIFTPNQCEKMLFTSSIQHRYSNPQPLEHESSPKTTRPGLPP